MSNDEKLAYYHELLKALDDKYRDRREDAEKAALLYAIKGDTSLFDSLGRIDDMLADGDISCECDECGEWDGISNRCVCGNRRVSWSFNHRLGWYAETY